MPSLTYVLSAVSSVGDIPAKLGKAACTSNSRFPTALVWALAGLAVGAVVLAYKQTRDKADLKKKNEVLQTELLKKDQDLNDMVNTVTEQKRGLEEKRDQLRDQLEEVETEREENKKRLQAVEMEITERERLFDKPEELLEEKEDLLQAQWKLDSTKKNCEGQIMYIEKLLEPLEIQVTEFNRQRPIQIFLD